jgi:hypothetical protein
VNHYLMIESRDPFATTAVEAQAELAIRLKRAGNAVAVYLVQNGVLPVRPGAQHAALGRLLDARVEVFADEFSLRERAIAPPQLLAGVKAAPIDLVVDRMLSGWTTLWH